MNQLSEKSRVTVLHLLLEGHGLRSTADIVGVSRNTVERILFDVGRSCLAIHNDIVCGFSYKSIQCQMMWTFLNPLIGKADKTSINDIWTWVAKDSATNLITNWLVGPLDYKSYEVFVSDFRLGVLEGGMEVSGRDESNSVKEITLSSIVDHRGIVNYSLLDLPLVFKKIASDESDFEGRVRSGMRLTKNEIRCLNKKILRYMYAVSLHYTFHNFGAKSDNSNKTPAMEVGIATHIWSLEEFLAL